ncbi:MAG: hypothetical protein ACSNEK_09250 [Parachlamydiaceae bacterium]
MANASISSYAQHAHLVPPPPILSIAHKPKRCRKHVAITIIALEILLLAAAIGCAGIALISGSAPVFLGIIPCALLMIGLAAGALCCIRPPKQNTRIFQRQTCYPEDNRPLIRAMPAVDEERYPAVYTIRWP